MTRDDLMTTDQLAEFLGGVALETLADWRKHGKGPVFTKIGKRVMYQRADVDSWLMAQRRQSTRDATR